MMNTTLHDVITNLLSEKKICRLVFLGDSITSAEWIHPNFREIVEYALKSHFEKTLGDWKTPSWNIRCLNAGFDGATTRDISSLLEEHVLRYEPQILLYQLGSNDNYFGITDDEYRDNLQNTVKRLIHKNIKVVLMSDLPSGYPEHNEKYAPRKKILEELVQKNNLPYLDLYRYFQNKDISTFFSLISTGNEEAGIKKGEIDKIHPNVIGNIHIAKAILASFFGISFDEKIYLEDLKDISVFYPRF